MDSASAKVIGQSTGRTMQWLNGLRKVRLTRNLLTMLTLYKTNLMAQGRRNDIIVVYDNFEFQENIKHQIIGEQPELRSMMTGKVISGADIPEGGLKQSMLNQSIGLEAKDINERVIRTGPIAAAAPPATSGDDEDDGGVGGDADAGD